MAIIIVAIVLVSLADHRANPGPGRAPDNRPLQPAAKQRTQHRAASPSNQGPLARPNASLVPLLAPLIVALVVPLIVALVVPLIIALVTLVVPAAVITPGILSAMTAIAHALVEPAPLLRAARKRRQCQKKRNNEECLPNPDHPPLDASTTRWG